MRKVLHCNWLFLLVALLTMAPGAYARKAESTLGCNGNRNSVNKCRQAPEGGPAIVYLLGAGITCFGAMFIRNRVQTS